MKLVPDWRAAWRMWSVRLNAVGAALCALALASPDVVLAAWQMLPPEILHRLPANVGMAVPLLLFGASGVARLIKQRKLRNVDVAQHRSSRS